MPNAWLTAAALAIAATTAPPKTRLWMPVDWPAKAGKSERYTPSTDHDAITPSTANRKSWLITRGTLGLVSLIRVVDRAAWVSSISTRLNRRMRTTSPTTAYGVTRGSGPYWARREADRMLPAMPTWNMMPLR